MTDSVPDAPVLGVVPGTEVLPARALTLSGGYTTTPTSGVEGGGGGSGNQTYLGGVGWGATDRTTVLFGFGVNDDPTYAPVNGQNIGQQQVAVALGVRRRFLEAGRLRMGVQGSAEAIWITSDPGLFNAGLERATERVSGFSVDVPVTAAIGDGWQASLVPSYVRLPATVMGAPFFGALFRVGARIDGRISETWTLIASTELPFGPGKNALRRDGALDRLATWRAGAAFRPTARVTLSASATNAAGGTGATRHLTQLGAPVTLYSVDLRYAPTVEEPADPRASDPAGSLESAGGITIPNPQTPPPGRGRLTVAFDSEGALGVQLAWGLGRRFQFDVLTVRIRGADAAAILDRDDEGTDAGVGDGLHYRFGPQVLLLDQQEGAAISLAGSATVGRDFEDQQGYLLVEMIADRTLAGGVSVSLNPLAVQSGARSLAAVGLGSRIPLGPFAVLPEWRVSLSGEPSVWAFGLRLPARGRLLADLFVTNAGSTLALGRMSADPRGARVGLGLNASL